ncbi:cystathionine beta-lyase [Campylobacter sp. MIT 99-7217]|uniref:MalY/PatB family protein n=1 Tax=Campylobacter sp. MIT 99-7217 TaxID=535091 RepID=UPI00115AB7AD|nr:MalY/PatB family protein [Campylobacter sp. MIT 99-7217]TQR29537.1 cystathionine beta-lyase [Campylobacter sp. MIT 99-7217]
MKFDFDKVHDRFGTNSVKYNCSKDILPMWVADMDFQTAPQIIKAMREKIELGIFGYEKVSDEFYESVMKWWKNEHKLELEKEWLIFCKGVVPALSSMIRKFTSINEGVLIQPPVYGVFYNIIKDNARKVVENPLIYDKKGYKIDFKDLENKLKEPQTTMMILCNPHNPIGKIWSKSELSKIASLCDKYGVLLVSDEIHCDISTKAFVPILSVSKRAISASSPSKAFNLASIHAAYVFAPDQKLRGRIKTAFNTDEIIEPSTLSMVASIAAYKHSKPWLKALNAYIAQNIAFASEFIEKNSKLKVVLGEATYLLWVDCSAICVNADEFFSFLYKKARLYVSKGSAFGAGGQSFLRLNLALPRARLEEGLKRLVKGAKEFELKAR